MKNLRPLVITFIIITTVIAIPLLVFGFSGGLPSAESEDDIQSFLKANGIITAGVAQKKTVFIPEKFSEVYENYNELLKTGGFDLYPYRGKQAQVYTYTVITFNGERAEHTETHIMIYDSLIIGGDVASTELSGEMHALKIP